MMSTPSQDEPVPDWFKIKAEQDSTTRSVTSRRIRKADAITTTLPLSQPTNKGGYISEHYQQLVTNVCSPYAADMMLK